MMYPFMTLENDTEIVHSEKLENGEVKVYVETPDERDGFHKMYVMMQKENELMHQEEIVEQLASEEEMEMFNF